MPEVKRKSILDTFAGIGESIRGAVKGLFGNGAEDDEAPVLVDDIEEEDRAANPVPGFGYNLSFCRYNDTDNRPKPFFYTTTLGDPFPSYHTNPSPNFPARWTLIDGVKMPCESLTAPRIRLSPIELKHKQRVLGRIRDAASMENQAPKPKVLNLSHQCLGDPYQFEAFVTFMDINKSVEVLNLTDNELDDITDLDLPNVKKLYASRNNFPSFQMLPPLPNVEAMYLNNNFITSFEGLTEERFPKLTRLSILHNPVEEHGEEEMRRRALKRIPRLVWLNEVPVRGWGCVNAAELISKE